MRASLQDRKACIIGLGYVGLTLAVAMAEAGFEVCGIERSEAILDCVRDGRAHFTEAGLNDHLAPIIQSGRLKVHDRIPDNDDSTIYVVTVGTPVGADKKTKLDAIKAVAGEVARVLKPDDLVVLRSTVRIGVSRDVVKPVLDATGVPYRLAFCPERTIEGKALEELVSLPQIVGGLDPASAERAGAVFNALTPEIVTVDSLEAAEMVKLVNNTHRDLSFAFANEVAAACEAVGVSAPAIIRAANYMYPRGGVPAPGPVGGPCLEKDPYILAEGLAAFDFTPQIALTGRIFNETLPARVAATIRRISERDRLSVDKVAILGLAFKGRPETSDMRGSLAGPLADAIRAAFPDVNLVGFDPVADHAEARAAGIEPVGDLSEAFSDASVVVIQNNHASFKDLDFARYAPMMAPGGFIYDLWAQNAGRALGLENIRYFSLGATA